MARNIPVNVGAGQPIGRRIPVNVGDGQTGIKPRLPRIPTIPVYWGVDSTKTGAAAAWDATLPDRTADTGAVDAKPYLPIILGRGRVVTPLLYASMGDTSVGWFVLPVCEGPFSTWENIWLNGNPMPGNGSYADYASGAQHWYVDQWIGDGSTSWSSKVPLKTAAHLVVYLFGNSYWPWQSLWVTHGSSLDAKVDFAVQGKGELCYDPRTATTIWTENPALQFRLLHVKYKGTDPALMNDTEIAAAADACEAAGFTCNLVIAKYELVDQAILEVLATCNGEPTDVGGRIGLILDQAQAGAAAFSFDEDQSELMDPKAEWLSAEARFTRITVTFPNAANSYKSDSVTVDDPGIALGTVTINEKSIVLNGVTTGAAAHAIALQTLNAATVLERNRFTIGWEGVLLSRFTKIHVKTKSGRDQDDLVLEVNEIDPGLFALVTKPYVAAVYSGTPITPPNPNYHPPAPSTQPSAIRVTDATLTNQVLSATDSTHDWYDIFQLVEYTLPSNSDATIDHLAVRGSEASDSQTKVWDDLASSETTVTPSGNETPTDVDHRNLSATAIPVRRATRVITYSTRPTVLTDVTTDKTTRILVRSVNAQGDVSAVVTVDYTAGVGTVVTAPPPSGAGLTSPLVIPPSGTVTGLGGEIQLRELAAGGTNSTGFGAPDTLAADLRYVLPATGPSVDGQALVFDGVTGGYAGRKITKWDLPYVEKLMVEQPSGAWTGRTYTLSQLPMTAKIVLIVDNMPLKGGYDFGRSGQTVTLALAANKPVNSIIAIYSYRGQVGSAVASSESVPLVGTAATWSAETIGSGSWVSAAFSPTLGTGQGMLAAVKTDGTTTDIATSIDGGVTWVPQTTPATGGYRTIIWGNNEFLATNHVNYNKTMKSSDGVTWVEHTTTGVSYLMGGPVVWTGSSYVMGRGANLGDGPFFTSPNGVAWVDLGNGGATGTTELAALCWWPDLSLLVGVRTSDVVLSSDGGVTWAHAATPFTGVPKSVTGSPLGLLVAAGDFGIATSPTGAVWTTQTTPPIGTYGLGPVVWSEARQLLVVLKQGADDGETGHKAVLTSPDGLAWASHTTPAFAGLGLVCANEIDTLVAVATYDSGNPTVALVLRSLA
jgi:Putative phage tail protein